MKSSNISEADKAKKDVVSLENNTLGGSQSLKHEIYVSDAADATFFLLASSFGLQRDLTNPEHMYDAIVQGLWEITQQAGDDAGYDLTQFSSREEYALQRYPHLATYAQLLSEYWEFAGPCPWAADKIECGRLSRLNPLLHSGLENAIFIMKKLDIKNRNALDRAASFQHAFLNKDLFEECCVQLGVEYIRDLFTQNTTGVDMLSTGVDHEALEKIMSFSSQIGFPSGEFSALEFMNFTQFNYPVQTVGAPGSIGAFEGKKQVHYLGSCRRELRFIAEVCGIPFADIFTLPLEDIARVCGIIRTLENSYYRSLGSTEYIEFAIGVAYSPLALTQIFSHEAIGQYIYGQVSHGAPLEETFVYGRDQVMYARNTLCSYSPSLQNLIGSEAQQFLDSTTPEEDLAQIRFQIKIMQYRNIRIALVEEGNIDLEKVLSIDDSQLHHWNKILGDTRGRSLTMQQRFSRDALRLYADRMVTSYESEVDITPYLSLYRFLSLHCPHVIGLPASSDVLQQDCIHAITLKKNALRKQSENLSTPTRNYQLMTALMKNTKPHVSSQYLLGDMNDILHGNEKHLGVLKKYVRAVQHISQQYTGLYSIGGKVHFPKSIPHTDVQKFVSQYNIPSTAFKLIHANTSVILPPSQFPQELMMLLAAMSESHLFDNDPQLQIAIPGRLPNSLGGILASSLLLLSQHLVEYTSESFATTHDSETGRRMVAYDAGTYDPSFPWNTPGIVGRTDVLLLTDINLIPKAQIIGSMLSQTEYDGMFAELGYEFIRDYCALLSRHNLEGVLQTPWIFDPSVSQDNENIQQHLASIQKLSEKKKRDHVIHAHSQQRQGLLVYELDDLLTSYVKKIRLIQQRYTG